MSESLRIFVVYKEGDYLHTVSYDGGNGLVRTYDRDQYDPRFWMGRDGTMPFFDRPLEAAEYLSTHQGIDGMIQVPVEHAQVYGFKPAELAPEHY